MKEHKQMFYFTITEACPDLHDADKLYQVLAYDGDVWSRVRYTQVTQYSGYTHWMQMPKHPSSTDRDA